MLLSIAPIAAVIAVVIEEPTDLCVIVGILSVLGLDLVNLARRRRVRGTMDFLALGIVVDDVVRHGFHPPSRQSVVGF